MANQLDVTNIPNRIWYVNITDRTDSKWSTRRLARARKRMLLASGTSATISYSKVTVGPSVPDSHS